MMFDAIHNGFEMGFWEMMEHIVVAHMNAQKMKARIVIAEKR